MKLIEKTGLTSRIDRQYVVVFTLVAACFALWGFANNVTTPMVNTFSKIFRMGATEASLVPIAFNLGYFCMAIPAAVFIQRYSFKLGILVGLGLYAVGALFFIPARSIGDFYPFLAAYFVLTCGLSFLETSCNPYVYSMGDERYGVLRLNAVQSLNALGTVAGMLVARSVQKGITPVTHEMRMNMPLGTFNTLKNHDLGVLIQPYIYIVAIVAIIFVLLAFCNLPHDKRAEQETDSGPLDIMKSLLHRVNYREGVVAEFCYVGAQVGCWTYIIQYGLRIFTAEGMGEQEAELLAQSYNIMALVCFACSRFICTWLMQWFSPARLLSAMGIIGMAALAGTIIFTDRNGLYCLVVVSICLSLMFPTIYGLALHGIGHETKIAGAGLIMAILGGSFFPPIQAMMIESRKSLLGLPSTNWSFIVPLLCLLVVTWYGHRAYVRLSISATE